MKLKPLSENINKPFIPPGKTVIDPFGGALKCPKHRQWIKKRKYGPSGNQTAERYCSNCEMEEQKQKALEPKAVPRIGRI